MSVCLTLALALVAATGCEKDEVAGPAPVDFTARRLVSGLDRPACVAAPAQEPGIWIVLKPGRILYLGPDSTLTTFLDITDRVTPPDRRGFLGLASLAFHPAYRDNGVFFVLYVDRVNYDVRLSRFRAQTGNLHVGDPASEEILLAWDRPLGAMHDLCHLEFEPRTGLLFVSFGDGTAGGEGGSESARDLSTIAGKMLRIDVDHQDPGLAYAIPPGNPFLDVPGARPEIWARGFRNPWRFCFDPETGDLYIADVGQAAWEEVNVEPPGNPGRDYGWNFLEGDACSRIDPDCNVDSLVAVHRLTRPVYVYGHDIQTGPGCSGAVIGGYVYRGRAIPNLYGHFLFADYCVGGYVWAFRYRNGRVRDARSLQEDLDLPLGVNVSSFGRDGFGELYIVAWYGGSIYKIEPVTPPEPGS
jgi:hypothetical protein